MKSNIALLAATMLVTLSLSAYAADDSAPASASSFAEPNGTKGELSGVTAVSEATNLQLLVQAHHLRSNGNFAGALAILDQLAVKLQSDPSTSPLLYTAYYDERGWTLLRMARPQEAISAFDSAIEQQPARYDAYLGRASARETRGDVAGSRMDYLQFIRWAPEPTVERPLDGTISRKLGLLGIDAATARLQPFGDGNPLRDYQDGLLAKSRAALQSAKTPEEKAKAYHDISVYLDGIERSSDALDAVDKALALEPASSANKQSRIVTLVNLNRAGDALDIAEPLRLQAHREAAASERPPEVFSKYQEASQGAAYACLLGQDWNHAIDAFADAAIGASPIDQDYMATMYLYVRAKSKEVASSNAYFENYIRQASAPIFGNYRRSLLLYWQGRASVRDVYEQIILLDSAVAIHLALAELWFNAAAYEKYVRHDSDASSMYATRLNVLRPYGTNEWMLLRREAL
ncbi:hypothetical protein [Burkholderia territorii]|uniref:hypothetical protein n=1 Tax=Burkholderia territorii TaxID=1503055 RepID=UPI0012DAEB63|nr:hypothetical protein [Burkholderia territorii]